MSETRSLNDKLKAAQEVASLSSTGRVLVANSAGDMQKLDVYALDVFFTLGHWYNPVFYTRTAAVPLQTWIKWVSTPSDIWTSARNTAGKDILVVRSVSSDGMPVVLYNVITSVDGSSTNTIPILLKAGTEWIWNPYVDVDAVLASISPDTLRGGGVKHYRSINYAILQKGGLRDEQDKGTYQRPAEGEDDGCDCQARCHRLRYMPYPGTLCRQRRAMGQSSEGLISVRDSSRLWQSRRISDSGIHPARQRIHMLAHVLQVVQFVNGPLGFLEEGYRRDVGLAFGKEVVAA